MDGDNLTLQCGSQILTNHPNYTGLYYYYWVVVDRKLGAKKLPQGNLILRQVNRRWRAGLPYGFTHRARIVGKLDLQLNGLNRYGTGKYICAVATITSRKPKRHYVEITNQNVVVKCKNVLN